MLRQNRHSKKVVGFFGVFSFLFDFGLIPILRRRACVGLWPCHWPCPCPCPCHGLVRSGAAAAADVDHMLQHVILAVHAVGVARVVELRHGRALRIPAHVGVRPDLDYVLVDA